MLLVRKSQLIQKQIMKKNHFAIVMKMSWKLGGKVH